MPIKIYSDISHSSKYSVAVLGFKRRGTDIIHTKLVTKIASNLAELLSVELAIAYYQKKFGHKFNLKNFIIYTDCQSAKLKFEQNLYPKNILIRKVKGHPKIRTNSQMEFSFVDKKTREKLRMLLD